MTNTPLLRADFLEIATILTISTYVGDRDLKSRTPGQLSSLISGGGWLYGREHYLTTDDYEGDEELVEVLEIQSGAIRIPGDATAMFEDKAMAQLFQSQPGALSIRQTEFDAMIAGATQTPRTNPWAIAAYQHNVADVLQTPVPGDIVLDFDDMPLFDIAGRIQEEIPYPKVRTMALTRVHEMMESGDKTTIASMAINVNARRSVIADRSLSEGYMMASRGLH